jgi:ParB family transcriptional regulator, chromosome partitioning protein
MAAKKFVRLTGAMQASALEQAEPDRLFGGSRRGMRLVEPRLDDVEINPGQPRRHFDPTALQALADSIRQHGQRQPVGVQMQENGRWLLVFGERRYRACRLLGFDTIQAVVTDGDPLEIALIENLQREDLTAFETADAFAGLMERRNYNRSTLAQVMGTTPGTVTRMLGLRALPVGIRREFETTHAHVAKSLLLELVDISDATTRLAAWERIKNGATVRELRDFRRSEADDLSDSSGESTNESANAGQMSEMNPVSGASPRRMSDETGRAVRRLQRLIAPFVDGSARPEGERLAELRELYETLGRIVG